jgi:conjugal transfer pilus assembly protein TraE
MDFPKLNTDLKDMRRRNRGLGLAVGGLVVCQVLSLSVILGIAGSERTVFVPPVIDRTFWVTRDKASREYLEEMAGFMSWLFLDVAPGTIDWKKNVLLNYVAPEDHGAMKTRMELEADRLRRINGSSSFLIQQFTASEQQQSVVLTGRLRRQINGQDTGEPETKSYLAQFQYAGGRIHIKAFKEIPYGPNAQVRVGAADGGSRTQ